MSTRALAAALAVLAAGCTGQGSPPLETAGPPPGEVVAGAAAGADAAFRAWLSEYAAAPAAGRPALVARGEALAGRRRALLRGLLLADPEQALALTLDSTGREGLPPEVARHLEAWRDGLGTLHVLCGLGAPGTAPGTERYVTFDELPGVALRAGVSGRRLLQPTRAHLPLHGVVLDGVIALTSSPLRALAPGEAAGAAWLKPTPTCPGGVALQVHDGQAPRAFCEPEAVATLEQALLAAEAPAPLDSAWTTGTKRLLYIRVDFDDRTGDPISLASAEATMNSTVRTFYEQASYGKTSTTTTITPTLRLPKTQAAYQANQDYLSLMADARAVARQNGFDTALYDLDLIAFASTFSGGWAGRGYVGGKGIWLNGYFDLRVVGHELGHNLGASHANFWQAPGLTVIGPGTSEEYGNPFDMMGSSGGAQSHFNAWVKWLFGWVPDAEVAVLAADGSGTYRVQSLETAVDGGLHALRLPRDAQRDYWLDFRTALSNQNLQNGADLDFGYPYPTTSNLLDTTPGDGDKANAPVVVGRTFSDALAGIHLTPVAKGGSAPQWLEVVVNRGSFPGNRPPVVSLSASTATPAVGQAVTFTAVASDPDGDALAYAWSFDDGALGPNAAAATHAFASARPYTVLLTVSDMKGQTASAGLVVVAGSGSGVVLQGQVLEGSAPLQGVRISDGTRGTFTASDGRYALSNVPDGGSVTLTATRPDYTFTATFAQPVHPLGGVAGLDFTATAVAGYPVSGTVTWNGAGVAGVTVSDGSRTTTTSGTGAYTLGAVPTGRYALTASAPGWSFAPTGFTNPLEVFGAAVAGAGFSATGNAVSGTIPAAAASPDAGAPPTVTDGVRTVPAFWRATPEGGGGPAWGWSLTGLPSGTWTLQASAPGVTLVPGNFTNPVAVPLATDGGLGGGTAGNGAAPSLAFALAAGGVPVSGTVRTGGTPLPGVVVSDGTRQATTDGLGHYTLPAEPPGSYTLTPSRAGYAFLPASRAVTVAGAPVTGQDFATTVVNLPPTVASPAAASPSPVAAGTTTQLTVLGADDGPEASLTYTWQATGPAAVAFSASGTNAARAATATFLRAGTYTLECTITDPGGLSVRSATTVTVQAVPTALTVSPPSAALLPLATSAFSSTLRDQFGQALYLSTSWAVSGGGTVAPVTGFSTTFTAGATPGGPFTLTATAGGKTATASVTVTPPGTPTLLGPPTATPATVAGATTALAVRATDDGGEAALTYRWALATGPAPVAFSANDSHAAQDAVATFSRAGSYTLQVTVTDAGGLTTTATVAVTVQATPTVLEVQPAAVALAPGQGQDFTASLSDQFGQPLAPVPALAWSVSGGGAVDGAGHFTAGATPGGPYTLTAALGALHATAEVLVKDATAPEVALTAPAEGAVLRGLAQLAATATDAVGVVRVEYWLDSATRLGEATAPPWTLEADLSAAPRGAHQLTARALDAAGNQGTSAPVAVTVVGAPPEVRLLAPLAGEATDLQLLVRVGATAEGAVSRVDLELDGAVALGLTAAPFHGQLRVGPGPHRLVAVATDGWGQQARSAAVDFTAQARGAQGGCGATGLEGGLAWALGALALLGRRRRR